MNNKKTNKNHTSHFSHLTSDHEGITLIALIITIIVMLILVGVTITVALNSGLFGTARKAAYQTEIAEIQEQLEIAKAVKVAENGGEEPSDYGITINDLPISDELKTKYGSKLVISKDGTLYYDPAIVTDEEERGWLEEIGISAYTGEEEDTTLSLLEKYFLGVDGAGRNFMGDIMDTSNMTFKTYDQIEEHPEEGLEFLNMGAVDAIKEGDKDYAIYDFYVKYGNAGYSVRSYADISMSEPIFITKSVTKTYEEKEESREGDKINIDINGDGEYSENETGWTIIYDYGNGTVEAVAPTVVGADLELGYGDTTINWEDEAVIAAADRDGDSTLSNLEKSIYSYNNAVKTINDYTKEQVTNSNIPKENIRSVGSNPDNPYSENTTPYTSTNLASWAYGKYNEVGYSPDGNYEQDLIRMSYHGVAGADNSYWLASRFVIAGPGRVDFDVRSVDSGGAFGRQRLVARVLRRQCGHE